MHQTNSPPSVLSEITYLRWGVGTLQGTEIQVRLASLEISKMPSTHWYEFIMKHPVFLSQRSRLPFSKFLTATFAAWNDSNICFPLFLALPVGGLLY